MTTLMIPRSQTRRLPDAHDSLRQRLKRDTSRLHMDLDQVVGAADLASKAGLTRFLIMQRIMLGMLGRHGLGNLAKGTIVELALRAKFDLHRLSTRLPFQPNLLSSDLADLHPEAVDYVVLGSRIGAEHLKRRWKTSQDPEVLAARSFMTASTDTGLWRACVRDLQGKAAQGAHADRVVDDARRLFSGFAQTASCGAFYEETGDDRSC